MTQHAEPLRGAQWLMESLCRAFFSEPPLLRGWCCPPSSEKGREANDSNPGRLRAIRCLVLPEPRVPKPNQSKPRREAASDNAGIL